MKNYILQFFAAMILIGLSSTTVFAVDRLPAELKKQLLLKQYSRAIPQLKILANKGDNAARYQLAICYLNGKGINPSTNEAVKLLRKASKKGHSKASYLLGSMYYNGDKITQDISAAKSYLFIASQKGHRLAKKLLHDIDILNSGSFMSRNDAQQRLNYAARTGNIDNAIDALKNGANINQKNKYADTPLIIASKNKQFPFVLWLLSKKPKLSQTDSNKDTALHILALTANSTLIKKLLIQGANIDSVNDNRRTPLINAVIAENPDLVKLLLSHGANPHLQDSQKKTVFDYANNKNNKIIKHFLKPYFTQKNKNVELTQRLQQLTKQTKQKSNLYFGWPLINVVVAQNELELAKLLLQKGEDPWQVTPAGDNAIALAVKDDHHELALELLKKATLDSPEKTLQAMNLLTIAADRNHFKLISQLSKMLPAGSPTRQKFLQTPLCHAINNSSEAAALQLIQWQQSDFRADKRGRNLLHLAASQGLAQVVLALIGKGFDVNSTDQSKRSALWYAAKFGHSKVMEALLSRKANINQADENGHTPLLQAVISNHKNSVSTAIKYGAEVNVKTTNGNTALIFASDSKPSIIQLLITKSAKVSARNQLSLTPLMIAVSKRCLQCVQLLIDAGANPNRKNVQGKNSFDLAEGIPDIIKIM